MKQAAIDDNALFMDKAAHQYKCWAALRDDEVIMTISMLVPHDVDFDAFRIRALSALDLLGTTATGDLYEFNGDHYFMPRPNKHRNRSKKKPKPIIKPLIITKR